MVRLYNKIADEEHPKRQNLKVHRLVAEYFDESFSPDKEVHHKNFDRSDNNIINLQSLTKKEHI